MWKEFCDWFWTDSFWLPYGFKWTDVKQCPISFLYLSPFLAVIILIVRYVFEHYFAVHFCSYIGIDMSRKPVDPELSDLGGTEKSPRPRSFPRFKQQQQIQQKQKASETCWRCFAYFFLFAYGACVIFRSDWFWDTDHWLVGYIHEQPFPEDLKWFYITELSFYMALLATHFNDTKRKDYAQQLLHHIATIILIAGSYLMAHFRYGSVIMLLHDASDYWLEAAKLAKYAKLQKTCDVLFVVFAALFYLTRWIYFPFWVCFPWWRDNAKLAGPMQSSFTIPYICLYLCFVLLALHLYWGFLIGKMIYNFTKTGTVDKDDRSDDDDE